MSYTAPTIGPAGLSIPSYQDILNYYISQFQTLYGSTVYLGTDSADYQLLALVALSAYDAMLALQASYLNVSPATATGAGLSALVALNGLQRKSASSSTCTVILTGVAGTVISGGIVQNSVTGDLWDLPDTVTLDGGGSATVIATAQVVGAINALANQLTVISTITSGWSSVTNSSNVAVLGAPIETDSKLRQRQAISTALPSLTTLDATIAAIAGTSGVTRYNVLENYTGSTDAFGNPAHSLTAVVEGGTALDVATAIYENRGIGVLTNGNVGGSPVGGTTTVAVTDPNSGVVTNISFIHPPTYVPIFVIINAHLLPSGGSLGAGQITAIQTAVAAYLNSLQIGEVVSFGELVQAAASSVNTNPAAPVISIRSPFFFGTSASPSTSTDIAISFSQVAQGFADNTHIVVNSV